ncbi:GNAT family N-acetyltransferase [Spirosoma linguale]
MRSQEAAEVSRLFQDVVHNLSYYNELARREEIAHYTDQKLQEKIQEDPYSVLVAVSENQIIGFCFNRFDDYTIWLEWIISVPDFRGKGVGTSLISKLITLSQQRKCHKVWCDCRTTNDISKRFLEQNGFEYITTIPNHWYQQDFVLLQRFI